MSNNKNKYTLIIETKLGVIVFGLFFLLSLYISSYQMFWKGTSIMVVSTINSNLINFILGLLQSMASIPLFFGIIWIGLILGTLCDYIVKGDI